MAEIFHRPLHPYTFGLMACDPAHQQTHTPRLPTIRGQVPDLARLPPGCSLAARCPLASLLCQTAPPLVAASPDRAARCHEVPG